MSEELVLFDIAPPENNGEIQETETEFLVIAFEQDKKKVMIKMLESLCDENQIKVYADYLFKIVKEKYEGKTPVKRETNFSKKLEESIEEIDYKVEEIYNFLKENHEENNSRL